jgi:MFS family permease
MSTPLATPLTYPTAVRWRIFAILVAFSFMSWFNRVSMSVAYDERIWKLGISETAIGWVYSAFLFVYMLFMTPGGWFADRFGARLALAVMGFGSALFGVWTGMIGFAVFSAGSVLVLLLVVRGLMGLFTAPIYPATGRILAHWLPAGQRAAANGAIMAAALVGISSTYVGFGTLLDWFDWPIAFVITGTITALAALLWTWYGRNRPQEHPGANAAELQWIGDNPQLDEPATRVSRGWLSLLSNRSLVLLTVSYGAIGYFEYLFYFWMHYYFEKVLTVGKTESRLFSTILSLAMAGGMLMGGWLSDRLAQGRGQRFGRTIVVVGGMLLGAALLGVGILATDVHMIVAYFAVAMAAVGATEGPMWATAIELGGRHGATAAGIFNTGGNAGGVIAPIITPLVSRYWGWQWGIGLGGLVCLAGACLWLWIDPSEGAAKKVSGTDITLLPKGKNAP